MKRWFLFGLGVFNLLIFAVLMALFGPPDHLRQVGWMAGFAVGGLLFIFAGLRDSLAIGSKSIEWHGITGIGYICFGIGMLAMTAPRPGGSREALFFDVFAMVTMVSMMLFLGVDFIRGGVHLDISKWN
ncbi:hypothetical protein C440_03833 [Haloferax mucosum ATCC BAA-1512]|uniref:Uncharacterized protein n=1 Tax=Haloferax mucosum ATCC BAA-1512 TaxID=662479 RepID=M0IN25_9EURY|nr:hypothetical protein [Haloferax mucosum]ELZ96874.1 hypothetical protein C440_03833 [Haloferax mucosum ATCC BAA-1512]